MLTGLSQGWYRFHVGRFLDFARKHGAQAWVLARASSSIIIGTPYLTKYLLQSFNAFQAATLSPLFFYSPALLARAGLYTAGVVGSLSYVGATAKYVILLVQGLRYSSCSS